MFRMPKTIFLSASFLVTGCVVSAFLITRASIHVPAPQTGSQQQLRTDRRNLSLRPEALNVSRRLGNRFRSSSRVTSTSTATLTLEGVPQPLIMVRRQTETGEAVELVVGNRRLMWSDLEGTRTVSGAPSNTDRLLVERLALDSPDQFVLAQLRGASYYTIMRNVRPAEAGENYTGPMWDIVRIDEPQRDAATMPESKYRLYYVNAQTGMIDKIVSELRGERIEAVVSDWTEQNGEQLPGQITWIKQGQILMQYRITTFSQVKQPD